MEEIGDNGKQKGKNKNKINQRRENIVYKNKEIKKV